MSRSDSHHVHGDLGNDDGFSGQHTDDPRIGASPEEIAHYNKLEADNPNTPLDVILETSPWLDTSVITA